MKLSDTVQALFAAINERDWSAASGLLAEDFQFAGADPEPQDATEWIALFRGLAGAMPDLRISALGFSEENDEVLAHIEMKGTQSEPLSVPHLSLEAPASGNAVAVGPEMSIVKVIDGKVASFVVHAPPDGSFAGILSQIGVTLPA
jgi:hypothetical protein